MGKEDFTATMLADGKITIPNKNREIWNIEIGDYVICKIIEVIPIKEVQEKEENITNKEPTEEKLSQ